MNTFKIGTLKVNGARDARKRALVFDTAKRKRIDVLFLQETHSDCGIEADWEKEWEGQVLLSHNTTLSGGVGLLFSRGCTPSSLEVEHVDTRRSIKDLEMEIVELEAIGSSTGDRGCIETLQSKKMALASLLDSQFLLWAGEKAWTGQELVEPGQIRQRAVEFFSSLYEILFNRLSVARVNWQKSEALAVGRGRTLVLNNLVASVLWHRLSCMEPPSGLLAQLQTRVLAFFWDGMHWVQQGVLYLPREEGGQGLIHLASRTTAFRIQFVQRFLTGLANLMWRDVARCVFRRAWALFKVEAVADPDLTPPARSGRGRPDLTGAEAVGSLLGIRSTQAAEGVLRLSRNRLGTRERRILEDYGQGTEPDSEDPFPEIRLVAHLGI
ncbi:hypothetical protein D4764_19G0000850 [Takifugu flavidus]|uniref:Uncharacterized protein n=1 Tax=Takifugu flavidus TaxID=433684 RepID=A0A5C6NRP5_9TELE|nr:hypothetical protein D4764_19G0000850 [Takifugu flavidus]